MLIYILYIYNYKSLKKPFSSNGTQLWGAVKTTNLNKI